MRPADLPAALLGAGLILAALALGGFVADTLALALPGAVVGLLLLLLALFARPSLATPMAPVSDLLHRHMGLFFVAPGVGLLAHGERVAAHWGALALAILVSTLAALVVAAFTFLALSRLAGNGREEGEGP